jgi:hypothetical protein
MDSKRRKVGKRVNLKAVGVLVVVAAAGGAGVYFLRGHQVRQNAHALTEEAAVAEKEGKTAEATDRLGQYLQLKPEDVEARAKLGLLEAKAAKTDKQKQAAYLTLSRVLQDGQRRTDILLELARLGLDLKRTQEVRTYLDDLRKAGHDTPEVARFQARCEAAEGKFTDAARSYAAATRYAPRAGGRPVLPGRRPARQGREGHH